MRTIIGLLIIPLLFAGPLPAAERMVTEVISIGYRDASEVASMLRPFVPPPGTVASFSDKLIVKTTPDNLRELKQLLNELDTAPTNLLVSVKHVLDEEVRRDLAEVSAEINSGDLSISAGGSTGDRRGLSVAGAEGDSSARLRVIQGSTATRSEAAQQIRVLEGKTAFIATGESRPLKQQTTVVQDGKVVVSEDVTYADANSGFYVRPRLSGDRVMLEIIPSQNRFVGESIQTREAQTTVSGRLGRWMAIAGNAESGSRKSRDIGRTAERRRSSDYTVYVKVTKLSD